MSDLRLYFNYVKVNVRSTLQYKTWPLSILTTIVNSIVDFMGVIILFSRFGNLGGWTRFHVLLVYGIAASSFGLAEWFSRGYDVFPYYVGAGNFDKILLRPRNTFLQVLGEKFEFQRFGRVGVGIFCIVYSLNTLGVHITSIKLLALIGSLIGGFLVYTSIFMLLSTLSFWTLQPLDIMYIFTNATLQYAQIPLPLLGRGIQSFLTFILPLGLCYYYPAMLICGSEASKWTGFMALPGGILFFIFSLFIWKVGVRHYHSSGS
ncbi:ABC-2 family transporter protein [Clostridium sp. 19966]|uniref:ABC transporter permease n=1 Tax=Clostridium sp. 19966 TaxID=2768166 RepID=UPI0028DD6CFA|nr:ABC-2 family transporter protein [Clostridium sp. 19966]MDT8719290.1 ABC-2 family transporter protein [Clostridium sp. 19966]